MLGDFKVIDFPPEKDAIAKGAGGFVYVVYWINGNIEVPFYVGATNGLSKRFDNYRTGKFTASTDFRVGE
jgi:hypothetical protein